MIVVTLYLFVSECNKLGTPFILYQLVKARYSDTNDLKMCTMITQDKATNQSTMKKHVSLHLVYYLFYSDYNWISSY